MTKSTIGWVACLIASGCFTAAVWLSEGAIVGLVAAGTCATLAATVCLDETKKESK